MARLLCTVVVTKNTEILMEKRTGEYGEDVEQVLHKPFQRVHKSFHSTSLHNIITVNAFKNCKTSDTIQERGQSDNRRYWVIYMNDARHHYLGTYSRIDSIDHLIKNFREKSRCWKYWN